MTVIVAGAGIFGVTAALELRRRGHGVRLLDPGPIPHPLAASTDISKVIRMEYGPDADYMALAEEARAGWLAWDAARAGRGADLLYHETGVLMICREPLRPGGFEYESRRLLEARGHRPERMDAVTIAARFPAWRDARFVDGFFHAEGGWAESGRVVAGLTDEARAAGVELVEGSAVARVAWAGGRVAGVVDRDGRTHHADHVVLAAGAWTGALLGELDESITATGHPVFHVRPRDPDLFRAERFPTFTADITRTGYYGFPLHPRDGVVKLGNHGVGVRIAPDAPRVVSHEARERLTAFLADTIPALADGEIVNARLCLYSDTQDGDFWIARHPEHGDLTVASGGSGHGFKFAPVLGGIIADAVEGKANRWLDRFRWRRDVRLARGREAARSYAPETAG